MNKRIFTALIVLLSLQCQCYAQKEKNLSAYKTENKIIYGLCFTNKGEALGIADDNTVKVFSTNSKEMIAEFKNGHKGQILTIDISKDSSLLVGGGRDSIITIWDFANKRVLRSLTFQKGVITSVKISPDCKYLVSGGTDNKVYLYDIAENKVIREYTKHRDVITSVAFSPDGRFFASSSGDRSINVYEVESGNLAAKLEGHKSWVRDISFSIDGKKLISCGDDSRVITWDISDINNVRKIKNTRSGFNWIMSVDFNQDGETYVSGDFGGKVLVNIPFGRYKANVRSPINKVLFKPNEDLYLKMAVATRGKGVILLDAEDMKLNMSNSRLSIQYIKKHHRHN